jgi:hypothetical protein
LKLLIQLLITAYSQMKITPIPQLPLELAIIEYCQKVAPDRIIKVPVVENKVIPRESVEIPVYKEEFKPVSEVDTKNEIQSVVSDFITIEKLNEHWKDVIDEMKPFNHSVAGMMRSTRPKTVGSGIVTIEAFYKFHQDKLSDIKVKEAIGGVLKKLFGEKVKIEVVLGKK